MKSPIQRRAAIAALLLAPTLTACGFNAQTDQVYQPGVGVNDRSGDVEILNALIVSGEEGEGTFAGTLVNSHQTEDDVLGSVTGEGITASRGAIEVPAGQSALLGHTGEMTVRGDDVAPGRFVELTFSFASGQTTTVSMPVVAATGAFADVPLPGEETHTEPDAGSDTGSDDETE